jgi:hypothetical protein
MKIWLTTFAVLFVLAQMYVWVKNFILPLPIYILGGAFLAIASNYDKGIFPAFTARTEDTETVLSQTATLLEQRESLNTATSDSASLPAQKKS